MLYSLRPALMDPRRPRFIKTLLACQIYSGHVRLVLARSINNMPILPNPVLLILDRNVDLVSVVSHGWTYQALVSDCLEIKLNRVVIPQQQKKSYDLDSKDFFWARNSANPFPQVAEEIDMELNKYKQDAAEITRSTGVSDVTDIAQLLVSGFPSVWNLSLTLCIVQGFVGQCCSSQDCYYTVARVDSTESNTGYPHEYRHRLAGADKEARFG